MSFNPFYWLGSGFDFLTDQQRQAQAEENRNIGMGLTADYQANADHRVHQFLRDQIHGGDPAYQPMQHYGDFENNYLSNILGTDSHVSPGDRFGTMMGQSPSQLYDPSGSHGLMDEMRSGMHGAQGDARSFFDEQLHGGMDTNAANLRSGLFGLADLTRGNMANLDSRRYALGETIPMLDLTDPEAAYNRSLTAGRESAGKAFNANVMQSVPDSFNASNSMGVDPFESGALGGARDAANNRRFDDLFAAQNAASAEREKVSEFNVGARGDALGREMTANSAIDTSIADLLKQEETSAAGLYGQRMTEDNGLLGKLFGDYNTRLTGIEGDYLPQLTAIQGGIDTNTMLGLHNEAGRVSDTRKALMDALAGSNSAYDARQTMFGNTRTADMNNLLASMHPDEAALMANIGLLSPGFTYYPERVTSYYNNRPQKAPDSGGIF